MNKHEYIEELLDAGKEYIDEYFECSFDPDEDFSDIFDDMQLRITGNDNGSYYCSSAKAKEAIADAMWDEEVVDAVRDLGYDGIPTDKGPEAVDVIIRFALLGEVYSDLECYFDDNKPSFDNLLGDLEYWMRNDEQPPNDILKFWHFMVERMQEAYE